MVITKTYRESITVTLLAAFVSMLTVIFAMWGITGQKRTFLVQKAELQKLTSDLSNLDKILSDEKTFAGIIAKVTATLPKEYSEVVTAISAIEVTAKSNSLTTDLSIDQKPKAEAGNLRSVTIAIKTAGLYGDISKFATDLSRLPYHTKVDSLTFDEAGGRVSATITIRLYMQ